MAITHPEGDGPDFEAEGARQRQERLARVGPMIEEIFEEVGKRQSIGAVLETIASVAFEVGVGRDELIHLIKTNIFASDGALEKALKTSINNEINLAYRGDRQGFQLMSENQKAAAETFLAHFVLAMRRDSTVSSFFHRLLAGHTKAGVVVNHDSHASVTKKSFSEWAHGFHVKHLIKNRFAELVDPVVYDEYDKNIRRRPEAYIEPLLPMVVFIGAPGEATFHLENLEKLIRDVCRAISFRDFIRMVKKYLPDETKIVVGAIKYARERWDEITDEEMNKRLHFREIEHNDDAVSTLRGRVQREVADELFEPKVLFDINASTDKREKIIIRIKTRQGQFIGSFRLHQSIFSDENLLRNHIENLLCKNDSRVVKILHEAGIRAFARNSLEINDLVARLWSYRMPKKKSPAPRRGKHSRHAP